MTVSLAIATFIVADLLLVAGLAYVMSRAKNLRPHVSAVSAAAPAPAARFAARPARPRPRRVARPLAATRS